MNGKTNSKTEAQPERLTPSGVPVNSLRDHEVISATGREDDIASALLFELERLHPRLAASFTSAWCEVYAYSQCGIAFGRMEDMDEEQRENLGDVVEHLMDDLNHRDIRPDGYTFGAHPGDGTRLGWWADDMSFDPDEVERDPAPVEQDGVTYTVRLVICAVHAEFEEDVPLMYSIPAGMLDAYPNLLLAVEAVNGLMAEDDKLGAPDVADMAETVADILEGDDYMG